MPYLIPSSLKLQIFVFIEVVAALVMVYAKY